MLSKWFDVIEDADKIPDNLRQKSDIVTKMFDAGIDYLRNPAKIPNLIINKLATFAWRIIANKIVLVGLVEEMPFGQPQTLHFWAESKNGKKFAIIMIPINWDKMCQEDHWMQLGGLVFTASRVADFYNNQLHTAADDRAHSYESEFLLTLQKNYPDVILNEYQKESLKLYPNGINSLKPEDQYKIKPYVSTDFEMLERGQNVIQ